MKICFFVHQVLTDMHSLSSNCSEARIVETQENLVLLSLYIKLKTKLDDNALYTCKMDCSPIFLPCLFGWYTPSHSRQCPLEMGACQELLAGQTRAWHTGRRQLSSMAARDFGEEEQHWIPPRMCQHSGWWNTDNTIVYVVGKLEHAARSEIHLLSQMKFSVTHWYASVNSLLIWEYVFPCASPAQCDQMGLDTIKVCIAIAGLDIL